MSRIRRSCCVVAVTVILIASCSPRPSVAGTVATDGTLGPARTLPGPRFAIGPDLGQQRGGNLFHSFRALNLDAGDSATFTGPASVKSVFARVTGGQPSSIDGTIRCTIPNANFFLINPAGVIFGPDAALDVKGSFAVTTADTIKLGANGSFDAARPAASTLTTAAPAAFGFLASRPAGIVVQGTPASPSHLAVLNGKSLSVVAGPIQIIDGELLAPAGRANLVAVGSPGQATFAAGAHGAIGVASFAAFADIRLSQNSQVNLDGPAGGGYFVRANNLILDNSAIFSTTLGSLRGSDGDIVASKTLRVIDGSSISNMLEGSGQGGSLNLMASRIIVDGSGSSALTGLFAREVAGATGKAGDLTIRAGSVRVLGGAEISTEVAGAGRGGNLSITASTLLLDDRGDPIPDTHTTGIFTLADGGSTGAAGRLTVHAGTVQLLAGGAISAGTLGAGRGGDLNLSAARVTLDDRGDLLPGGNTTGIFDQAYNGATGAAGTLTLHAGAVRVLAGASIATTTFGAGRGGNLNLTAASLTLDDRGDPIPSAHASGIFASSNSADPGAGDAGDLTIHAGPVRVRAGSQIAASTFGGGRGGKLNLTASSLNLDDHGDPLPTGNITGIFAAANSGSTAAAGTLAIHAQTVRVLRGAQIAANTSGSGRGGNLSVTASSIRVDDRGDPLLSGSITGIFALARAGSTGAAGDLTLRAGTVQVLAGAQISASTSGAGRSGSLSLTASEITTDDRGNPLSDSHTTGILARANGDSTGAAGNLTIHADIVRILAGAEISADTFGPGAGGSLSLVASSVILNGRGNPDPRAQLTGVFADTNSVNIGAGDAGSLTINANAVRIRTGALISAGTFGTGKGGNLSVTASSITVDGAGSASFTAIAAESDLDSTNAAGDLKIHGGTVRVLRGAEIAASTFGTGRGGNLSITASRLILDDRGDRNPTAPTGVAANSQLRTQGGGDAGDLSIHAGAISVLGDAQITANTFGPGRGGNLRITARRLRLDDRGDINVNGFNSGVFANSQSAAAGSGDAGNLTIDAGAVSVFAGAQISASTNGSGRGGNLNLTASRITLDTAGSFFFTGIETQANNGSTGAAGNLTVRGGVVSVLAGAEIADSTFGSGRGGNLSITASSLVVDDAGDLGSIFRTSGVFANSLSGFQGAGAAGALSIHARTLNVLNGGSIAAGTFGPGAGGSVVIGAGTVNVDGANTAGSSSQIVAESSGAGAAGSVRVSAHDGITLSRGARVSASSIFTTAGDVRISSNGQIVLDGGQITATAQQAAGNVIINTPLFLQLDNQSLIGTKSVEQNGGNITLSALEVSLRQSRINADAPAGQGGNIAVAADARPGLIFTGPIAQRNVTATGKAGVSGNIQNAPANSDVAKSVTALPASLNNGELTLQPQCGQMLEMSTFLVQGRGTVAEEPGFWQMDFGLQTPAPEKAGESR